MDTDTGRSTHVLHGHYDYSFATAWHPNGQVCFCLCLSVFVGVGVSVYLYVCTCVNVGPPYKTQFPHATTIQIVATGNQDKTVRVWDLRYHKTALAVLQGRMGAIRSLRFSSDGRFLAAAEPADFVHVYDVGAALNKAQVCCVCFLGGMRTCVMGVANHCVLV